MLGSVTLTIVKSTPRVATRTLLALIASIGVLAGTLAVAAPAHADLGDQAIEGTVSVEGLVGTLTGNVVVRFIGEPTDPDSNGLTGVIEPDGSYRVDLYEPGSYQVCIERDSRNWAESCWNDGAAVSVSADTVVAGIDFATTQFGGIQGTLLAGGSGVPAINGSLVARLFQDTPEGYVFVEEVGTGSPFNGTYRFPSLEPGTYAIEYSHLEGWFSREYWEDVRYFGQHTPVTVTAGPSVVLGDTVLEPRTYDRLRLAGPDRFATAVAVSRELFPGEDPNVPVIYIANGLNYPDALAAGPAASYLGGGLLLVTPTSIPEVVAEELERLQPDRIVVVGGTPSVSAGVKSALEEFSADVDRIGGADRFATSRMIVADAWGDDASEHAFIATGLNFPDALAAVPAAGVRGAPIILVPGTAASLDTTTRNLLTGLEVEVIHLVGSAATVSTGIESSVISLVGEDNYVRYAGFDRFATAVLVSIGNFGVAENAFVATGFGFADALAGGPLAAASGSPMYLSNGTCLYNFVMSDIEAVGANRVVLLGSAATLSTGVENLDVCGGGVSAEVAKDLLRLPEGVRAE